MNRIPAPFVLGMFLSLALFAFAPTHAAAQSPKPGETPFGSALASIGSAASDTSMPQFLARAGDSDSSGSEKKQWTKGGKVLTFIGIGLIGAGAVAMAVGGTTEIASDGSVTYGIDWRKTGAVWAGIGGGLTVAGLLWRR